MTLTLLASQLIAALFLFVTTLICGVLPTWLGKILLEKRQSVKNITDDNIINNHNNQHHHNHNQIQIQTHHQQQPSQHQHHHQQHQTQFPRGVNGENQSKLATTATGKKILSFLMNLGGEDTCTFTKIPYLW